jgi:hypothetical protein
MSQELSEQFKTMLINEGAKQDLQKLLKGDKEMAKEKKGPDFLDKFWQKNEKAIENIQKKYSLGLDELGDLLMKLAERAVDGVELMLNYTEILSEDMKITRIKQDGDTFAIGLDSNGALHVRINDEYFVIDQADNLKEIKKTLKRL